jgi:Ca-activated chloride channel family protein
MSSLSTTLFLKKYKKMKQFKLHALCSPFLLLCFVLLLVQCSSDEDTTLSNRDFDADSSISGAFELNGNGSFDPSGEGYNSFEENAWIEVSDEPVSTFSIDADGASYSNTRRYLNEHEELPPVDAIRTEEFINYFTYNYENPTDEHPISLNGEICMHPWQSGKKLLRIGIRGKDIPKATLPPANFVYLIDVSGSMSNPNKLGLLKESFKIFTDHLRPEDRIAIVTYAGSAGVLLNSTPGSDKETIKNAIDQLGAGGSTAGAQGIITAYQIALDHFIPGGNNRVILGSDGDFNVGISSQEELIKLIEEKRDLGIFLTILGVGTGNLQDGKMEQIANNGNGNYEYIDNIDQGVKVFVEEFNKFYTVAKDVKIQIEFDADQISAYRLIGYENRLLENQDFEDDEKDAGEIGSNQTITALYEIEPISSGSDFTPAVKVDFRYKNPDEDVSIPLTLDIDDSNLPFEYASENTRFAASVAGFGLLLRNSQYKGSLNYDYILNWADQASSNDPEGWRAEFRDLVLKAKGL